jgi:hypothetical protein
MPRSLEPAPDSNGLAESSALVEYLIRVLFCRAFVASNLLVSEFVLLVTILGSSACRTIYLVKVNLELLVVA